MDADLLISYCSEFRLEYRITDESVTVTKRFSPASAVTVKINTGYTGDKKRILCALLWASRATPFTAQEMADDFEI